MPKSRRSRSIMSKPPSFTSSVRCQHTFRYQASSAIDNDSILSSDLLNMLVVAFGAGTQTGYRVIQGLRLKNVKVWAFAESSTPVTISFNWLSQYGPAETISDSSAGATYPAHLNLTPPRGSAASFWRLSGTDETERLATFDLPVGAIVDVSVEFYLNNNSTGTFTPVTYTGAGAALTPGVMYGGLLDKASLGFLFPVGLSSAA